MKRFVVSVIAVITLVVLLPAVTSAQSPDESAKAAQGLAWRLRSEANVLKTPPSTFIEVKWTEGNIALRRGNWKQAQKAFEACSASLIDQAVEEGWQGELPIPAYIFEEATIGVVCRGWSLKETRERVTRASNPEPQVITTGGPREVLSTFVFESKVIVHVDPRFLMKYLNVEAIYHGSEFWLIEDVWSPLLVFPIPQTKGNTRWVRLTAFAPTPDAPRGTGWIETVYKEVGPIGPNSAWEVMLP